MSHIMETGYRHMRQAKFVPRDIITSFTCRFNGNEIFRADLFPASPQPVHHLLHHRDESGKFEFNGSATRDFPRPRRLRYRSNEIFGAIAVALLIAGSAFAAEIPQADRRSGYAS